MTAAQDARATLPDAQDKPSASQLGIATESSHSFVAAPDPVNRSERGASGSAKAEEPAVAKAETGASPEETGEKANQKAGDAEPPPEAGRTKLETTLIILALCAALFLAALDVTIVTVAIPSIAEEFHSTAGYTWIGAAYMIGTAAAGPIWGKISDIWGRKQILLVAVSTFWAGSLLSALSVDMAMLIAARAVQGVGGGGIVILVNICISDLFSMRKRGVYFGIMGMVWAVAGALGPVVGGAFTSKVTWRWCFYINLPISGVGLLVLIFVLKLHNPRTPMKQGLAAVDWLGALTIVGGTLMVLLGLELGGITYPWSSPTVLCLIVFGAVVVGLFVIIEWKVAKYPIIPMRLFERSSSVASLGCAACHGFVFISGSYYMPLYFQAALGASPLLSGVYILPFSVSLAISSAISGMLIKKWGKYQPFIIGGMAMMSLGYGLFLDLDERPNWAKIVIFQLIAGIGIGPNFQSPLLALQTTVRPGDIGSATATYGFIRMLFTSISVVVGGVLFQDGMQRQYPWLLKTLGPDIADLLSGANAAASVGLVAQLPGPDGEKARGAYWHALRTMYIMYVLVAVLGLGISLFVGSRTLSKEHEEHKTGLGGMQKAKEVEMHMKRALSGASKGAAPADEEKAEAIPAEHGGYGEASRTEAVAAEKEET